MFDGDKDLLYFFILPLTIFFIILIICGIYQIHVDSLVEKSTATYYNGVVIAKLYVETEVHYINKYPEKFLVSFHINELNKNERVDDKDLFFSVNEGDSVIVRLKEYNGKKKYNIKRK